MNCFFFLIYIILFSTYACYNWSEGGNVEPGMEAESRADGLLYSEWMGARNDGTSVRDFWFWCV